MKMGNAAVGFCEIAAGRGNIARRRAVPNHADRNFGIEIVASGETRRGERVDQRGEWINAETEKRIIDAASEEFEEDERNGELATLEAELRCFGAEDGFAED